MCICGLQKKSKLKIVSAIDTNLKINNLKQSAIDLVATEVADMECF